MDGYDMGGGWVLMIIAWAAVLAVVVWAVVRIAPGARVTRGAPSELPLEILDRRLASGEIDADTYDGLRARLTGDPREPAIAARRDG